MIKLVRVDHRLIHGQVAFSWTKFLGVDCILVTGDEIVKDELRVNMLRIAKPSNVKLIIKPLDESIKAINAGQTDKYKMMILTESIEDAHRLFMGADELKELNLGGTKTQENRRQISKAVHISNEDEALIRELVDKGVEVSVQMVPDDSKIDVTKLI